jgi:hypothetical protein
MMPNWVWIWLAATFYAVWSSSYFGRNWFPKSEAEMVTDGITLLLIALALVCRAVESKK